MTPVAGVPVIEGVVNVNGYVDAEQWEVLHATWPNLTINCTGRIIKFEDQVAKQICVTNWGGVSGAGGVAGVEGEITMEQAAKVSSLGTKFRANTTDLSPLRYFTGVTWLANGEFKADAAYTHKVIVLPPNVNTINANNYITDYVNIDFIYVGPKLISITAGRLFGRAPLILVMDFPPRFSPDKIWRQMQSTLTIYVPDAYLNDWKTNASWSSQANKIHPLSEYTGVRYWEVH